MPGPRPLEFDIGVQVSSTIDEDGFEDVQHDAEGEDTSGALPMERHHFYGFWGRALDPELNQVANGNGDAPTGQPNPAKGAQVLTAHEGSVGHAWTMEDPRVIAIIPVPEPGCGVMYGVNLAAGKSGDQLGCCYVRTRSDGSVVTTTTTTNGGVDGITVVDVVSPQGFVRQSPWGKEMFGSFGGVWTGYSLSTLGGARMTFSAPVGLPGPAGSLSATIAFNAGIFRIEAPVIGIGPKGKPKDAVAKCKPLMSALQGVVTALEAVVVDISTAAGAGQTSKAAVTQLQTAIAGLLVLMATDTQIG